MDNVVGSATIVIRPSSVGFEEALAAETNAPLGNFEKRAAKTGEEGGKKLAKGFSSGTSGIASTLNSLGVPFTNLGGHLTKTADQMARVDQSGSHLGATMAALGGKALLGVGVAFAGVAAAGVDLAMKQEKVTASIANSEGISVKAANNISNAFLATAGTAVYSGKTIGEAYSEVAGELGAVAGHALTTGEAMKVMNASMDLAEATGVGLGSATAALGKIMLAYHLQAGEAAHASDILFNAAKQTGTSVESLAQQLQRIKGRLGELAPSLAETGGLMETLAKHGITGRQSLSALNGTFTTLIGGGKATQTMAKELGLTIFDSSGKFVGLEKVITQLQPKLAGLTQQSQLQATKALFGASANKQMLDVILQGPAAFNASTTAVSKSGAAHEAAKKQAETLGGQMKILRAAAEDLATKIGQVLIPILTKMASGLREGIEWLKKHETAAKALAGVIATVLGGAIGAFVAVKVAAFVSGIGRMVTAMVAMGTKMLVTVGVMGGAEDAMVAGADTAAAGIDAAMMGTIVGIVLVGVGLAVYELVEHWEAAMQAIEKATAAAANFVAERLEEMTLGLVEIGRVHTGSEEAVAEGTRLPGGRKEEEEAEKEGTSSGKGGGSWVKQAQSAGGLSGNVSPHKFAEAVVLAMGAPTSSIKAVEAWMAQEGGNWHNTAKYNPLNTTLSLPGSRGTGTQGNIGSYTSWGQGLEATLKTLASPAYSHVVGALQQGKSTKQIEEAINASPWGTKFAGVGSSAGSSEAKHTAAMVQHSKALEGAGKLTEATTHKAAKATGEAYIDPFANATGVTRSRTDQGVDFSFGGALGAIAPGVISKIISDPGGFGTELVEKITAGTKKGQYLYYGLETGATSNVTAGQHVKAGQRVATGKGTGGIELGFASGPGGVPITPYASGASHGTPTAGGQEFSKFLASLGKGGSKLETASKTFEEQSKAMAQKVATDVKAGQSEQSKLVGAIQSGGVKELSALVGGAHEKGFSALIKKLVADGTAASKKLEAALVKVHKEALAALAKAMEKAVEVGKMGELKYADTISRDITEGMVTAISDSTRVTLDRAAEAGKQGADLTAAQALTHLDVVKASDDAAIAAAKQAADRLGEGHGSELQQAQAARALSTAEDQAKINEANAQAAVDLANNAASEAKVTEERTKTEQERLKVEKERLAQEQKTGTTGAGPAANFTIVIPEGTKMNASELLQEIGWHIHSGALPVAA